ncbi:hypothetical protein NQ315_014646 [Exocentrus adspersus]|uniref:Chromo domain-containing protein n=1 Tax=Exocentrus adspersus TaxID=1586481 RepID=A0AAV8VQB9_9CUCU|nr:hypothetical protein NQ315_014646 [Exocentrus adspersus]
MKTHSKEKIQLVNELHIAARKNYPRRRTIIKGLDDLWQMDLAEIHIKIMGQPKFKVGDIVRVSNSKHVFEKSYKPNWTTELFKIVKVQITNPITYLLEDMEEHPIRGGFYEEELQKTSNPDIFLVEKVLKRKGKKVYVRWLGFHKCHDSWIDITNVV